MAKTKMTDEEKKARRAERRKARKAADAETKTEKKSKKSRKSESEPKPKKERKSKKERKPRTKKTQVVEPVEPIEIPSEPTEHKVRVICDPVKPKKKAVAKKLENGEYIPTPKNFTNLKNYVTTYYRAMKWKTRENDYVFPDTNIHIRDFKVIKHKPEKTIEITFQATIELPNARYAKQISKTYTLENHKEVRSDIIHVYREVRDTKLVKGDKVKEKELLKRNWIKIY